jgi:hypothetical protein
VRFTHIVYQYRQSGLVEFEVHIAMGMKSTVVWHVMPCGLVDVHGHFGTTYGPCPEVGTTLVNIT